MGLNKFSEIISAKVIDNRAILLTARHNHTPFSVIGSSMMLNAQQQSINNCTNHVTIYPKSGQDGIIAICAPNDPYGVTDSPLYGFLHVTWKDTDGQKHPFIEVEKWWSPSERVGHMQEDVITVKIRGKTFFSSPNSKIAGHRVNDPNLLCRYLAKTATATEILHFATQARVEKSSRAQLVDVQERNMRLGAQVRELERKALNLRQGAKHIVARAEKLPKFARSNKTNALIEAFAQ